MIAQWVSDHHKADRFTVYALQSETPALRFSGTGMGLTFKIFAMRDYM